MIDAQAVHDAMADSLYREAELPPDLVPGDVPAGAIVVPAIVATYALHPGRLETHRAEVTDWLSQLNPGFRRSVGGGWSFLQACMVRGENGEWNHQWGEHREMEALFVLGIGLGLAKWALPREMWDALPGGMPYVIVEM